MRIVNLIVEDVKRVLHVDIEPEPGLIQIAGKNGSGKTSLLTAIEWCLSANRVIERDPVRRGQERALISLGLGEGKTVQYRVTKTIRTAPDGTIHAKLRVEDPDGPVNRRPQEVLNSFLGNLTLDPLAFINAKPDERIDILKRLVPGIEWDTIEARRRRLYDARTEYGRELKRLEGVVASMPEVEAPPVPVDLAPLKEALANAGQIAESVAREAARRTALFSGIESDERKALQIRSHIEDLSKEAFRLEDKIRTDREALDKLPPLPEAPDTAGLVKEMLAAEDVNRLVEQRAQRARMVASRDAAARMVEEKAEQIAALDGAVQKAVAEADLPVDGLSLGTEDVELDGFPFGQVNSARQLRVATALAMAQNPDLKIILIRKGGNDLDADAMAVLKEVAEEEGFDIWIERVEPAGKAAVVMEEGKPRAEANEG